MEHEHLYEQIALEIESQELKQGVWAKAFADADGDEGKARARYIKLRVEQLVEDANGLAKGARRTPETARKSVPLYQRPTVGRAFSFLGGAICLGIGGLYVAVAIESGNFLAILMSFLFFWISWMLIRLS